MSCRYRSIILFSLLGFACSKEPRVLPSKLIETGLDIRIHDMIAINDSTWIVCGGIRDQEGWILKTTDGGTTWKYWTNGVPRSIYTLGRAGSTLWAGGDYLQLWKSTDDGETWTYHWLADEVPYHEQDRPAIRQFCFNDSMAGYFVGGENLGEGVIYHTSDAGFSWQFLSGQHEFRGITTSPGNSVIAAGHGEVTSAAVGSMDWNPIPGLPDDFYTGITQGGNNQVLCSYTGDLWISNDDGTTWSRCALEKNGHRNNRWNSIAFADGEFVAAGADGILAISEDTGNSFQVLSTASGEDIYKILPENGHFLAGSDHGHLWLISKNE